MQVFLPSCASCLVFLNRNLDLTSLASKLSPVVNEPVHLVQEFRDFDFLSPWEGMQYQIANPPARDDAEQKG